MSRRREAGMEGKATVKGKTDVPAEELVPTQMWAFETLLRLSMAGPVTIKDEKLREKLRNRGGNAVAPDRRRSVVY